jgi:hypothetical protein
MPKSALPEIVFVDSITDGASISEACSASPTLMLAAMIFLGPQNSLPGSALMHRQPVNGITVADRHQPIDRHQRLWLGSAEFGISHREIPICPRSRP